MSQQPFEADTVSAPILQKRRGSQAKSHTTNPQSAVLEVCPGSGAFKPRGVLTLFSLHSISMFINACEPL